MNKILQAFFPTAAAIERLLYPYAEVVVHDIKRNQIAAIYHPFSKRKVGDSSLFSEEELMATLNDTVGPYEKMNWDGKKLKSVSSAIRDEKNQVVGLLCINLDMSVFEKFKQLLTDFAGTAYLQSQPEPLFKDDWQERINRYVHDYLKSQQLTLDSLSREQKKALIEHLYSIGAFAGKNSALYIAKIVKTSRATVYNYLANHTTSEKK